MTARSACVALAAGALAWGCGSSDSPPQITAVALADATRAGGSVRFDLWDGSGHRVRGTFDFEHLNGAATDVWDPEYPTTFRWVDGLLYISSGADEPGASSDPCAGRAWISMTLDGEPPPTDVLPVPFDPSELITKLAQSDVTLVPAGDDTLGGVTARRFDVEGDVASLLPAWADVGAVAPGENQEPIDGVRLWIDGDDRLRRIEWISPTTGSSHIDYSDFGVAVARQPVADDEVCSLDEATAGWDF